MKLLREYIRKLIFEVEGDKTSLAENGDCGVFAVALLRALAARGFYDASFVVIADAEDYEGDYPIPFPAFYDMDIFHICLEIGGKYYDIRSERDIDEMLRNFVPYGGGGIEPKDYTPTDRRDYVADAYGVPSDAAIDFLEKFVLSSTNVQTSVENYADEAEAIAEKIAGGK
jgi:hypothetical protein